MLNFYLIATWCTIRAWKPLRIVHIKVKGMRWWQNLNMGIPNSTLAACLNYMHICCMHSSNVFSGIFPWAQALNEEYWIIQYSHTTRPLRITPVYFQMQNLLYKNLKSAGTPDYFQFLCRQPTPEEPSSSHSERNWILQTVFRFYKKFSHCCKWWLFCIPRWYFTYDRY